MSYVSMDLRHGDCLDELDALNERSIDLVVTDLPYGQTNCAWDCPIDLSVLWQKLTRVSKENAAYCFFATTRFGATLIASNPSWFRYDLVWIKNRSTGFLNANKMPLRNHEMVYVFYKNTPTYNPQKHKGGRARFYNRKKDRCSLYGVIKRTSTYSDGERHPTSTLKFGISNAERGLHATQKPVALLEWLIRSYSNEGDTVLDCTMGSGSTGIACINAGRKFIGIEKDVDIFNASKQRIHGHHAQLALKHDLAA